MKKTLLPEGYREDLPMQIQVTIGGVTVGLPYMQDDVDVPCYKWYTFLTMSQASKFMDKVAERTEALLTEGQEGQDGPD